VKRFFNGNPDYLTAIDALQTSIEPEEVYAE